MDKQSAKIEDPNVVASQMQWGQFDKFEEDNLGDLASQASKKSVQQKPKGPKMNKKQKKQSDIQQYQIALSQVRKKSKFILPFQSNIKLNITKMQAIKVLRDAIQKDKDFSSALRYIGCKTRMRVRNKTAAKQLFQIILKYLQEGVVPTWMQQKHKELLEKDDSKFDQYIRIQQRDDM